MSRGPAAGRIIVVEDDAQLLDQLVFALKKEFDVSTARDAVAGRALLDTDPDLCLFDLRLPPSLRVEEGLELLRDARRRDPDATVVVMSGEAERDAALSAVAAGAFDFFRKPVDPAELMLILRRALERRRLLVENRGLLEEARAVPRFEGLVGESDAMKGLFRAIEKVAPSEASVLLTGESGTGKELVSRAIHEASRRKGGPFVAVNASALPDSLAEAELFGHEKGAFTGAVGSRPGRFELAHGGTLFLDEIGTLSPAVQAKLLRALEAREIERVGGRRAIPVDFRLICATNEDLVARVRAGTFREDLLYRVNSVPLEIPPLRERAGDVARLARHFLGRFAERDRRPARRFSDAALSLLSAHPWRGNVRELEHAVEMLVLFAEGEEIVEEDLPRALRAGVAAGAGAGEPSAGSFDEAVRGFEKGLLTRAIAAAGGAKAQAGRSLGLDANQMKYLCRKYGL